MLGYIKLSAFSACDFSSFTETEMLNNTKNNPKVLLFYEVFVILRANRRKKSIYSFCREGVRLLYKKLIKKTKSPERAI